MSDPFEGLPDQPEAARLLRAAIGNAAIGDDANGDAIDDKALERA